MSHGSAGPPPSRGPACPWGRPSGNRLAESTGTRCRSSWFWPRVANRSGSRFAAAVPVPPGYLQPIRPVERRSRSVLAQGTARDREGGRPRRPRVRLCLVHSQRVLLRGCFPSLVRSKFTQSFSRSRRGSGKIFTKTRLLPIPGQLEAHPKLFPKPSWLRQNLHQNRIASHPWSAQVQPMQNLELK